MTIERSVCSACGYAGGPVKTAPGSTGVEIVLWLFLMVPGLIYSIWRVSSQFAACRSCGKDTLIPAGSPRGVELLQARGDGWSTDAEESFQASRHSAWLGRLWWVGFSWFWVIAWHAINVDGLAGVSGVIAVVLTLFTVAAHPRWAN
jgi:hypothetical protein